MNAFPYQRLIVLGVTGSGKSTFAARLAALLYLDCIDLDALHWDPHWTEAPLEVFRSRLETATRSGRWVTAGNYHVVRDLTWPRAEAAFWLDYPLPVVFLRLLKRTLHRVVTREELWNGNRENLLTQLKFWSPDSIFHWLFRTYWRRKREYPLLFRAPEHRHMKVIRFRTPAEAEAWLLDLQGLISKVSGQSGSNLL